MGIKKAFGGGKMRHFKDYQYEPFEDFTEINKICPIIPKRSFNQPYWEWCKFAVEEDNGRN